MRLQEFCNHAPSALLSEQCSKSFRRRARHYVSDSVKKRDAGNEAGSIGQLEECRLSVTASPLYVGFIRPRPDQIIPVKQCVRWIHGCEGSCWGIWAPWLLDLLGMRETGGQLLVAGQPGQIGRKMLNSKEFFSIEYQSLRCIEPSA